MKIVSFMMLSLLMPLTFAGLVVPSYGFVDHNPQKLKSQTFTVYSETAPLVQKENYLLDVEWPVVEYTNTSSGFGSRYIVNCPRCSTYHLGVDFTPGYGKAVYNIMDGEIVDVGWDGTYGYRVVIQHVIHPNELEYTTIYAHLQDSYISGYYNPGDMVKKGEIIGLVGNTGLSTGPHLHFEVHRNDNVMNPMDFFSKHIK